MKKQLFLLLTILSTTTHLHAATFTWLGSTSSDFNTASNWSGGGGAIPDSADHITISSSATNNLLLDQNRKISNLTLSSKTIDLNGYSLTVYGTATMTSGTVTNGTFYARGTLAAFNGTLMDCLVDADCGYIRFSGSTFNSTVTAADQGVATGTGAGGCTFNDDVTIIHGGNGTYFTLAGTTGDVFNADLTVINYSSHEVHLSNTSSTQYKGNLMLSSTGTGGITFGNSGGTSTLDSGKTITIGSTGFTNDVLLLKNFTQLGNTAQTLTLTGTAVASFNGSTFNGEITVSSPGILLKNSTFNGMSSFTKTGTSNAQSDGGNVFNYATTISNTAASGRIRMATVSGDTYNADATFNSTGQDVQIAYSGDNTFAGNITINSNKVVFNTSTGKVTFTGTSNQTLNGSYNYPFKKMAINKSSGTVTTNTTLSVDDSLIFIQGNLITTSTNLLTMKHGSTSTGASNSSFVSGPVKKVGNGAFEYPIGKESSYLPLTISAPATTSSEFVAEYIDEDTYVNSTTRDSTLGYILRDKYWTLQRTSGSSQVYVTLSWNADFRMMDSLITVASWNGAQWKNLGANPFTGSFVQGSVTGTSVSTSYNEFSLGYLSLIMRPGLNCADVTNQSDLQSCLSSAMSGDVIQITSGFELVDDDVSFNLPLEVHSGVTVTGYVTSGNSYPNWWEVSCPLLTSEFKALYDPTSKADMFLFQLDNGAIIKNLRLRGSNCNYQDFNFDNFLSGGIVSKEIGSALAMTVENCEVSCFSYAGIMTHPQCSLFNAKNSYVHHVKGVGKTVGIGYGVWVMGGDGITFPYYETTLHNNIFDDCKAAIDGQGHPINWNITKCSFSQFFVSEDINRHNSNLFKIRSVNDDPTPTVPIPYDYHYCYINSSNLCNSSTITDAYWGPMLDVPFPCSVVNNFPAVPSYTTGWIPPSTLNGIPIYDVGGINTTINSCIFHKVWGNESASSNINLNFPNRDESNGRNGKANAQISITENTFTVTRHAPDAFVNMPDATKNRGGFARLADNYIDACVFQGDPKIITTNNSFDYQSGRAVSGTSPQPCEMKLSLKDNTGTNLLPTGLNFSTTSGQTFIQHVDLGTTPSYTPMKLFIDEGSFGGAGHTYIIRPNQININAVSSTIPGVISEENHFYDSEIRTSNISSGVAISGYSSPGLYGIDVLSFDATSNPLDFRASSWNHIPVIVKPSTPNTKMLYFNIKDSYVLPAIPISAIPVQEVYKQVELNGFPIWKESIAEGGNGWEYVAVDLNGSVLSPATGTILSKLNLDGTPNVLTFSLVIKDGETINYSDLKGLMVWIDNVYIPKANSATGDNAIKDGSIELSNMEKWGTTLNDACFWYQPENPYAISCAPLSITSGASGESRLQDLPRDQNGDTLRIAASGGVSMDGKITRNERRSGQQALIIKLIAFKDDPLSSCTAYPDNDGEPLVSVATHLDITDLLTCYDYWTPEYHESQPNGGSSKVGFEPFLYPVAMTTYTKKKFYVGSSFTIGNTETLTFTGCDLVFAPGVEITIESGGALIINADANNPITRSHLFSCDEMWQGIIVEDGGSLTINGQITGITGRFCTIQNAIKAVHLPGDPSGSTSDVIIRNTNFTDNLVSIYAKDCQIPGTSQISGNNFGVTNAIITKEPCMGVYPENHIYLNNVLDATIGVGSSINMSNYFTGVKIGINAINSDLKVQNSEFDNLVDYAVSPSQKGIGINAQNGTITPRIIEVDSRFRNLHRGIFTRGNFDVTIQGCDHFRDIDETAISINSMNYQNTITITDNPQFQRTNIGIRVTGGKLSSVTISNNKLNNTDFIETNSGSFHNTGITVQKWSSSLFADNVTIFDNEITNCRIGIHANNVKNLTIGKVLQNPTTLLGNIITSNYQTGFAPAEIYRGIWVQNSNNAFIVGNEVVNIYEITGSTTNFRGIEIQNCYDGRLNCNTIDNIPLSFYIFGRCDGTLLRKNTMSHYDAGIELESATIAPQFQINNSTGDEEPIDNVWTDDPAPFGDATDRVTGTTNSGQVLWLYQTSNGDYNPLDGGTTSPVVNAVDDGAGIVACDDVSNRQSRETRFAATVGDSLVFDAFEVEQTWMARKYAYESMRSDSTLLYQDTLTDQIYQDFFWREDSLNTGKFGTIRLLSADTSYFGTAEAINEAVFDEIDLETNLKLANSYFFNNLAIDEPFNSADSSAVLALAELPYYAAGEAAFIAFGMLGLERTPYIPVLRIAPEIIIPIQNSNPPQNSIQLFPVPVNNYIHVGSSILTIDKVEIFDSQLKLVDQKVIHSREFEMSTGFNPGVYGMKFYLADGTIQWKKLVKL